MRQTARRANGDARPLLPIRPFPFGSRPLVSVGRFSGNGRSTGSGGFFLARSSFVSCRTDVLRWRARTHTRIHTRSHANGTRTWCDTDVHASVKIVTDEYFALLLTFGVLMMLPWSMSLIAAVVIVVFDDVVVAVVVVVVVAVGCCRSEIWARDTRCLMHAHTTLSSTVVDTGGDWRGGGGARYACCGGGDATVVSGGAIGGAHARSPAYPSLNTRQRYTTMKPPPPTTVFRTPRWGDGPAAATTADNGGARTTKTCRRYQHAAIFYGFLFTFSLFLFSVSLDHMIRIVFLLWPYLLMS